MAVLLAGAALEWPRSRPTRPRPPTRGAPYGTPRTPRRAPPGGGSRDKTRAAGTTTPVQDVRAGRHACFDRMVVDVPGADTGRLGYFVRYVDRLHQDGSGRPIAVGGGAVPRGPGRRARIPPRDRRPHVSGAGRPALPGVDLAGYRTFRDARFAGNFEGEN